jgi:hypothetical protein
MARLAPLVLCAAVVAPRATHAEPQVSDVDRQIAAASDRLETRVERHNAARSDLAATRVRAAATSGRIAEVARGHEQRASLRKLDEQQSRQEAEPGALTAQVDIDIAALKVFRDQIGSTSRRAPTTSDGTAESAQPPQPPPPASVAAGKAVAFACAQLGEPTSWPRTDPVHMTARA